VAEDAVLVDDCEEVVVRRRTSLAALAALFLWWLAMWPAVRHNRCTRFSPTLMPSSWSTLHATATGTRMWAPVAAISRTSGKTIFSAGSRR
jgi:hypothetical protein